MKLGGGNTAMHLHPSKTNITHRRFQEIGDRQAMCYNDCWQPFGPKYAGANGAVMCVPVENQPFSLFMKRTHKRVVLGWEYCGEYISDLQSDFEDAPFIMARTIRPEQKEFMIGDFLRSMRNPNGGWHEIMDDWRRRLTEALESDPSAPPVWMVGLLQPRPVKAIRRWQLEPEDWDFVPTFPMMPWLSWS